MALKIRCGQCRKKISIDEAFAGSVCRCPYCKALTLVPGELVPPGGEPAGPRPQRPGAPVPEAPPRPAAPHAAVGPAPDHPAGPPEHHVPLARPVLVQGIVALVASGLLVVLLAAAAAFYVTVLRRSGPRAPGAGPPATAVAPAPGEQPIPPGLPGARLAGMRLTAPVVYVIDASSAMRDTFDLHAGVLQQSLAWLKDTDEFNVLLVREEGVKELSPSRLRGDAQGRDKAGEFLATVIPSGATDLPRAVEQAIASAPKSVVVLSDKPIPDPEGLIELAKDNAVAVYAISVGPPEGDQEPTGRLCRESGGEFRRFGSPEGLAALLRAAPAP